MISLFTVKDNRRSKTFQDATALDLYIRKNKFSKDAVIIMKDSNGNNIGTLKVSFYKKSK